MYGICVDSNFFNKALLSKITVPVSFLFLDPAVGKKFWGKGNPDMYNMFFFTEN